MRKKYIAIVIGMIFIIMIIIFSNIFLIKTVEVVFDKPPQYTNESQIIEIANIEMNSNIFNLSEKKIEENVAKHFSDNRVSITDIERSFPNKVTIFMTERTPLLIVSYEDENSQKCIPTDIDFQLIDKFHKSDINYQAIKVSGAYVERSFNQPTFRNIRKVLYGLLALNFNEESLAEFIAEINITDNLILLKLRYGDCTLEVDTKSELSISQQINQLYEKYLELDHKKRDVFYLSLTA